MSYKIRDLVRSMYGPVVADELERRATTPLVAWDLIGRVPPSHHVRIKGGRTLYEEASYNDATSRTGDRVRLSRLDTHDGLKQVNRWVAGDTPVELVNASGEVEPDYYARDLAGV